MLALLYVFEKILARGGLWSERTEGLPLLRLGLGANIAGLLRDTLAFVVLAAISV